MEQILKYLSNPLQMGVFYANYTADFSNLEQFVRDVAESVKKDKTESKELLRIAHQIEERHLPFSLIVSNFFNRAMRTFVATKECPKEITDYIIGPESEEGKGLETRIDILRRRKLFLIRRRGRTEFFKDQIFEDINDVLSIGLEELHSNTISFDVTSTKKDGITRFYKFLSCIPHIGKTVKEVKKRKTHSSRYAFRPYALAVSLWLKSDSANTVFRDLRDFLKGSIRYFSDEEWRTAIVLSAIAVESVLADLYEEHFKEYAPNVPLGNLYERIKDKMKFPPHIQTAITMVNEARISAVHRSRFPVSDREATNALYGATTFIMWYSIDFKL